MTLGGGGSFLTPFGLDTGLVSFTTLELHKIGQLCEKFGPQYVSARPSILFLDFDADVAFMGRDPQFCYTMEISHNTHRWIEHFFTFNGRRYDAIQSLKWVPLAKTRYTYARSYTLDRFLARPPLNALSCMTLICSFMDGPEQARKICFRNF